MDRSKKSFSLDELETSLKQITSQSPPSSGELPPGFTVAPKVTSPPIQMTLIRPSSSDPFAHFMTERERRLITKMHISQLKSEFPEIEDYYYREYMASSRAAEDETEEDIGKNPQLLFVLPTRHHKKSPITSPSASSASISKKETAESSSLISEFGKVSKSTSSRPRQQLNFPSLPKQISPSPDEHFATAMQIEDLFLAALKNEKIPETCESAFDNLPNILASSKGQKALRSCLKRLSLEDEFCLKFVDSLIDNFELLNVARPKTKQAESDAFISNILSAIAPMISEFDSDQIIRLCLKWMNKKSFSWLIYCRLGIVLTCMLLSRAELSKQHLVSPGGEDSSAIYTKYTNTVQQTFSPLLENLNDIFEFAAPPGTSDFYVWQLFALISVNLNRNQKRAIVAELRDRIMGIISKDEPGALATLNLFLNALGLDATQLKQ
jgi:hypothetical protein